VYRLAGLVVLVGCRGILGIDDPTVAASDAKPRLDSANCTGDDYDADGIPDSCDPCPMFPAVADDRDSDNDGLDDACDPRPQDPGDTRLLWTHFASDQDIATWAKLGGTWMVVNGALRQASATGTAALALPGTQSTVSILTRIDVVARGTNPSAGVCGYAAQNAFKCCDLRSTGSGAAELMASNNLAMSVVDANLAFQAGTSYELTNVTSGLQHQCRLASDITAELHSGEAPGLIALRTEQASVAYRYLFVVQMP